MDLIDSKYIHDTPSTQGDGCIDSGRCPLLTTTDIPACVHYYACYCYRDRHMVLPLAFCTHHCRCLTPTARMGRIGSFFLLFRPAVAGAWF